MLTFHHIGLACRDLDQETVVQTLLGYVPEGPEYDDPQQEVKVRFLIGGGPRLELVMPTSSTSPAAGVLARGARLYHMAYETHDIGRAVQDFEAKKFKLIVKPVPAVAFNMRLIAFMMSPTLDLIEFIQADSGGST